MENLISKFLMDMNNPIVLGSFIVMVFSALLTWFAYACAGHSATAKEATLDKVKDLEATIICQLRADNAALAEKLDEANAKLDSLLAKVGAKG